MIAIIDYGMGNLKSVIKAFAYLGFEAVITEDPKVILAADKVVLPGVGAFKEGMKAINERGLLEVIKEVSLKGTPLLGICLGMQLLFDESDEFGVTQGLGLLKGKVKLIDDFNHTLPIPHMGWNSISTKENPLTKGITNPCCYFVHSYYVSTNENVCGVTHYGNDLTAMVQKGNIFGCQFHPEKSGKTGLQILKNFGDL